MAEVILMPRLSDTMTEGVIAAWHKKVGDPVKKGDLLAEVETDKATMELESYKDGTLLHIGTDKGGKLQVNDLLAIIGTPGEDISSLIKGGAAAAAPAAEKPAAPQQAAAPQPQPQPQQQAAPAAAPASGGSIDLSTVPEVILMPRLSDTMTEGVIAEWHKKVGDAVKKGDLLADVETDKATMELESYKEGKLLYIGAQKGDKVPVNALLCIIGDESKVDVNAIVAAAKGGPAPAAAGAAQPQQAEQPQQAAQPAASSAPAPAAASTSEDGRVKASPLAKKIASDKGIDLAKVSGSGDGGRIVKKDIDNYVPAAASSSAPAAAASSAPAAPAGQVSFEEVPVSQMRKVIAKRLAESKFSAPHFYVTMNINMDKAVESRAKLNEVSPAKISFNDMVLKACAIALKKHPKVNSSWLGDKIRINHHVNIGVAVAVEEGLLVPVVRFADTKSLSQIAAEVKVAAQKAKDKKLQPADWEGNTFTISNLGMFGVDEFTAIINPPDACILAIGAINQVPVVKDGQIVVGNIMKVTLSCDHRVVDGASGAAFLQTLQGLLEEPLTMLV
ncbi:pyruvate dehydrogenase complex dihydrolipoamide acetyltransferase [Pseudobacter ginsenosidimutans]|uniref:Acetyltransferase component of pyruvate dehydrogenase complex n=1 Tax=Pseudobacter ginsenosidimutans TaxID=661488 RepID=A0A4V2F0Q2_9BACT|nr:pyruvate dehydrogenase complex dihydrolipoamide acetyltransferase [Pseudobacter ginsenosidimutans]QEC42236.1 pyruvate dehydrogenase complex dihydrolipoamide acetyltransferase [Pseudobacter ginsenosidimutans]RZS70921.1 pyruvate dehydrogenase E2 component (dihydrolipoamide acetyltransferase) [Pseudobacter ginsenosidimutans]